MTDSSNLANKDVDVDELGIKIFMLVKDTSSMTACVNFLIRRGWQTECMNNISKAISTIVKQAPDIVMISINHPNPNVTRLPQLLSQSLNTITIGFSETADSFSLGKLNQTSFQHKFNGYPSGPSFHRFIRQLLDRVHNPHKYEEKVRETNSRLGFQENQTIEIKGDATSSKSLSLNHSSSTGPIKIKGSAEAMAFHPSQSPSEGKTGGPTSTYIKADTNRAPLSSLGTLGPAQAQREKNQSQSEPQVSESSIQKTGASARHQERASLTKNSAALGDNEGAEDREVSRTGPQSQSLATKGSPEQLDEQGFKKKPRPQRKMYAWQKEQVPQEDAIKNHPSRPGASFELKQSRGELRAETTKEEQSPRQSHSPVDTITKKPKDETPEPLTQSGSVKKPAMDLTTSVARAKFHEAEVEPGEGSEKRARSANAREDLSSKQKTHEGESPEGSSGDQAIELDSANRNSKPETNNQYDGSGKKSTASRELKSDSKLQNKASSDAEEVLPKRLSTEAEDRFRSLMKEALKSVALDADPEIKIDIEEVDRIGVIPLNSQVISGYVVISRSGVGFEIGSDLLDTLLFSIERMASERGLPITCQSPFVIQTHKFNFDFWKENVGLFTLFEQSHREELALTFLQSGEGVPEMNVSKIDPEMVTIKVKDLNVDIPVDFKTYIYLERNNKFYRYLNDGRSLLARQKTKLAGEKNSGELHIARSDFKKFQQYLARNLINSLLEEALKQTKASQAG